MLKNPESNASPSKTPQNGVLSSISNFFKSIFGEKANPQKPEDFEGLEEDFTITDNITGSSMGNGIELQPEDYEGLEDEESSPVHSNENRQTNPLKSPLSILIEPSSTRYKCPICQDTTGKCTVALHPEKEPLIVRCQLNDNPDSRESIKFELLPEPVKGENALRIALQALTQPGDVIMFKASFPQGKGENSIYLPSSNVVTEYYDLDHTQLEINTIDGVHQRREDNTLDYKPKTITHKNMGWDYLNILSRNHNADIFWIPNDPTAKSPFGGIAGGDIKAVRVAVWESDKQPFDSSEEDTNRPNAEKKEGAISRIKVLSGLGIVPTFTVDSGIPCNENSPGGKSPQAIIVYSKPTEDKELGAEINRMFVISNFADPSIATTVGGLNREVRLPGVYRPSRDAEQAIVQFSGKKYSPEEIKELFKKMFPYGCSEKRFKTYKQFLKKINKCNGLASEEQKELLSELWLLCSIPEEELDNFYKSEYEYELPAYTIPENPLGNTTVVPLIELCAKGKREWIEKGIKKGNEGRDGTGLILASYLLGIREVAKVLGVNTTNDILEILDLYCNNCTPALTHDIAVKLYNNALKSHSLENFIAKNCKEDYAFDDHKRRILNATKYYLLKHAPEEWAKIRPIEMVDGANAPIPELEPGAIDAKISDLIAKLQPISIEGRSVGSLEDLEYVRHGRACDVQYFREKYGNPKIEYDPNAFINSYFNDENLEWLDSDEFQTQKWAKQKVDYLQIKRDRDMERWRDLRKFTPDFTVHQRYLNLTHNIDGKIDAVKSKIGTGKTTDYVRRVNEEGNVGVGVISHRHVLATETIENLRGTHFKEMSQEELIQELKTDGKFSITIDSLRKIKGHEHLFSNFRILIDEANSWLGHFLSIDPHSLADILEVLKKVLMNARSVTLLDGHLYDWTVEYFYDLTEHTKEVIKTENTHLSDSLDIDVIDYSVDNELDLNATPGEELGEIDKNDWSYIYERIQQEDGSQPFVVCGDFSVPKSNAINRMIQEKGISTVLINRDTSQTQNTKEFTANSTKYITEKKPGAFIYSPTMDSGVDISIRNYFKTQYVMCSWIVSASGAVQRLGRIRDPLVKRIIVTKNYAVGENYDFGNCDIRPMYDAFREKFYAQQNALFEGKERDFATMQEISYRADKLANEYRDSPIIRAYYNFKCMDKFEKIRGRDCLLEILKEDGHKVNIIKVLSSANSEERLKELTQEEKKKISDREYEAPLINEQDYNQLRSQIKTPEDAAKIKKYEKERYCPGFVSSEAWTPENVFELNFGNTSLPYQINRRILFDNPEVAQKIARDSKIYRLNLMEWYNKYIPTPNGENFDFLKIHKLEQANFKWFLDPNNIWNTETEQYKEFAKTLHTVSFQVAMGLEPRTNYKGQKFPQKLDVTRFIKKTAEWLGYKIGKANNGKKVRNGDKVGYMYQVDVEYQKAQLYQVLEYGCRQRLKDYLDGNKPEVQIVYRNDPKVSEKSGQKPVETENSLRHVQTLIAVSIEDVAT